MQRTGSPQEIAYAVKFLASKEADYITGQSISVDGGMICKNGYIFKNK